MCENLSCNQQESQSRERDLNRLRPALFGRDLLRSPLRRGSCSQGSYSPYNIKIENGPKNGDSHHQNSAFARMNGKYKSGNERGSRQRTQPNQSAKAADSQHSGTSTLQQNKKEARQTDEPRTLSRSFSCRYRAVFCHDTRILISEFICPLGRRAKMERGYNQNHQISDEIVQTMPAYSCQL